MTRPIKRACVRDRWAAQVWRTHAASTGCRFVLAYMANAQDSQGRHLMAGPGYWKQPQADTCAALGLSDRRLRDRLTEAVDVGLLTRNGGGYRGQTVTFLAQLVDEPKPTERRRTGAAFEDEKGGGRVPPLGAEKGGGLQPPYLWRDPRCQWVRYSWPAPSAGGRADPQPRSRWSARGRTTLTAARTGACCSPRRRTGSGVQVTGGSRSGAMAGGCRNRGGVRGRPALSRCTQSSALAAAT